MIKNIMITVVPVCQSHKKQRENGEKKRTKVEWGRKKQRGEKLEIREKQERRGKEERRAKERESYYPHSGSSSRHSRLL